MQRDPPHPPYDQSPAPKRSNYCVAVRPQSVCSAPTLQQRGSQPYEQPQSLVNGYEETAPASSSAHQPRRPDAQQDVTATPPSPGKPHSFTHPPSPSAAPAPTCCTLPCPFRPCRLRSRANSSASRPVPTYIVQQPLLPRVGLVALATVALQVDCLPTPHSLPPSRRRLPTSPSPPLAQNMSSTPSIRVYDSHRYPLPLHNRPSIPSPAVAMAIPRVRKLVFPPAQRLQSVWTALLNSCA